MNWKIFPFVIMLTLSALKLIQLFEKNWFYVVGWLLFSGIYLWICWAFWKKKKMPSYSGKFDLKKNEGKFERVTYLATTCVTFLIAYLYV